MRSSAPIGPAAARRRLRRISRVILVGSGKGGVGKSTVACSLALALASEGRRTGLLDLDIHGASVPRYLGLGPPVVSGEGGLQPKLCGNLKVMSVGLFTGSNPVPMRGDDKQELISQLFGLTEWGVLDYLVVDLPPSMGDELLAAFRVFSRKAVLILVTTPSPVALDVVARLRRLASDERVKVAGAVLNMERLGLGKHVSFPFGRIGPSMLKDALGVDVTIAVPMEPMLSALGPEAVLGEGGDFAAAFKRLASVVAASDPRRKARTA
jgi:ATP-binding protein involved in chromosome partitioning